MPAAPIGDRLRLADIWLIDCLSEYATFLAIRKIAI